MITSRAVSKSAGCVNCRLGLVKAFVSAGGLLVRPVSIPSSTRLLPMNRVCGKGIRQFETYRSDDTVELAAQAEILAPAQDEKMQELRQHADASEAQQATESTPWYLEVDPPKKESDVFLQRQRLPDLPPDPPPLLQPMMDHIFVDLGLDDLILFDLRKVDPPPALGANLLMVIGTARSEKHLHVSADKFCKWMKTTHHIAPYADGLLGRGELKLKLRRKARRARILSRVGSAETTNTDDGLRTGWICVTMDNVEGGKRGEELQDTASDDFVGFGGEEGGVKIVIQMLTQEKREELDLEDHWGKTMRRHERKQIRISRGIEDIEPQNQVGQHPLHDEGQSSDLPSIISSSHHSMPRPFHNQTRQMHISARRLVDKLSPTLVDAEPVTTTPHEAVERSGEPTVADDFLAALPFEYEKRIKDDGEDSAADYRLKAHLDFAKSLYLEDAYSLFITDAGDAASTPFLRSFRDSIPSNATAEHWGICLSLLNLAISIDVPGYSKRGLALLFSKMKSSMSSIPPSIYRDIIITLLRPTPASSNSNTPLLTAESLYAVAETIEDMALYCPDIAQVFPTDDLEQRGLLEYAIIREQASLTTAAESHSKTLIKLRRLLNKIYPEPAPLELQLRKLKACAQTGNFEGMWDIWRSFAAELRPRSAELYVAMFQLFAQSRHQARNMEVLRELVPEMEREEPPVKLDVEVAAAIKTCISMVELGVERDAMMGYENEGFGETEPLGELPRLWLRCEKVVQEEGRWARELDDDL